MIIKIREDIKQRLEEGFKECQKKPALFITSFPDEKEAMTELEIKAKPYTNGAIFITWLSERPGKKEAGLYPEFIDVFTVFIFSNSKQSDEEIIEFYETARDILHKKYFLYYGEMSPVKSKKTGLYMAYLQVGVTNIYQGES
jgi:hypothetical protein